MTNDILAQIVADLVSFSEKFNLQVHKTTNVFNLIVVIRYVKDDVIEDIYLL